MVHGADIGVVQVQQEAAARSPDDLGEEGSLVEARGGEFDVGAGVFQQQSAPEAVLDLVHVVADPGQAGLVVRDRQGVVVECPAVAGPGEVLREPLGLEAPQQGVESAEMPGIKGPDPVDREPNPVDRQGEALANLLQMTQIGPARDHVVLGVDLEELQGGALPKNLRDLAGLQSNADGGRSWGWVGHGRFSGARPAVGLTSP